MPRSLQTIALMVLAVIATSAVWHYADAESVDARLPAASAPPPPQLVQGLPDFTRLVTEVGSGVVSIEAVHDGSSGTAAGRQAPQIPEIFRDLLGPGFRLPGPSDGPRGISMGSGFIISEDGYILTNHHVVDGADEVTVRLSDRREFTARVVGSDKMSDVALLKIDADNLAPLKIGDSDALRPGQWVVAIGSPFGFDHSVTAGIVSAVGRMNPYANQRYVPFIQTDVAINKGNSGGPLLDTRGRVVGINSQIFSNSGGYMGVSFAIPIDMAMNVVAQLKDSGQVSRGQIGVSLRPMDDEIVEALGLELPDRRGALVWQVLADTPAASVGLRPGDVIRKFNGTTIDVWSQLPPLVGALPPGTQTQMTVLRDGKLLEIDLVLGELGESSRVAQAASPSPAPATGNNPLGLVGKALDDDARRQLDLDAGEGVVIARIEGVAARSAGLSPGDVVLEVAGEPVGSPRELDKRLNAIDPGKTVMLLVRSEGTTQFVAVTLQ